MMSKLEFVDSHIHFWNLQHPELHYAHLQPGFKHPFIKDLEKLGESNYLVDDYVAETRDSNVVKAIHVQAAVGSKDPVKETKWLQEIADLRGFPHAIVAYSDLRDPNVEVDLDRHCHYANMRGIRDFSYGDYLVEPEFHRGFALLEKYNLVASLDVKWEDMGKLRDLAEKFPNIPIVLDHCGFPLERTVEYFKKWKIGMSNLGKAKNMICKISGLGMCDPNWTVDSIRPWVLHCIEAFGPERCLFATNWPVDKLRSTYDAVIEAYTEIIANFSQDEQKDMFSKNAEELYRV
ncbi:amidohydrolase family protein [Dehalococcoidia bacterium]|nr:amidohydrolase family protein [Dehalococcoidia bacterium]